MYISRPTRTTVSVILLVHYFLRLYKLTKITILVNYLLVEKRTPHYQLDVIQEVVARYGIAAFTRTARLNSYAMGLTDADMLAVVCSLQRENFYKSMTSFADHTLWQDVYHAVTPVGMVAYIKVSRPDEGKPVIQFKEK